MLVLIVQFPRAHRVNAPSLQPVIDVRGFAYLLECDDARAGTSSILLIGGSAGVAHAARARVAHRLGHLAYAPQLYEHTDMAKDSSIEWTHHTFNPWWGCVKVSPACTHCYAETWARRFDRNLWGRRAKRRFFGEQYWREPLRWNAEAQRTGERRRVFCASMADVFEPRSDLDAWRERLWALIEETPSLNWLLLTKRPGQIKRLYPWIHNPKENVWLGTTAESQQWADKRVRRLVAIDAHVRFLSCEPLLSALDLSTWLKNEQISWVIAGGESGSGARPTHPNWIRSLRDQCERHGVPFHFKQWGHWGPSKEEAADKKTIELRDERGKLELLSWQPKLRSGRVLDGRTWDGYPH